MLTKSTQASLSCWATICVTFLGFGWHLLTLLGSYLWNNWILSTFLNRAITVLKQLSLVYLVINGIISLDFPSDMLGWLVLITVGVGLIILLSYWFISFKLWFNNPLGRCWNCCCSRPNWCWGFLFYFFLHHSASDFQSVELTPKLILTLILTVRFMTVYSTLPFRASTFISTWSPSHSPQVSLS